MNASRWIALLVSAGLLSCGAGGERDGSVSTHPSLLLAEQLRSEDMRVRTAAWGRVRSAHEANIAALLQVAGTKEEDLWSKMLRSRAIEMLGEYRAGAAVDLLIEQIEAPPSDGFVDGPEPSRTYPTVQALLKIGEPAISRILAVRTAKPMTERQLKLFCYLIWMHYAPLQEQEVGLFRMERLLANERESRRRRAEGGTDGGVSVREKNLAQLVEVYKTIGPRAPADWPKHREETGE